jgi:amino acid adenylation domain-containing protein
MNLVQLIEELSKRGVELWLDGERLRYRAPEGSLPPALLDLLREHKPGLIRLLEDRAAGQQRPLSYGQRALWFLYRNAPASTAYNTAVALHVRSRLDRPALGRSLQALIARHSSLRTAFSSQGEQPTRIVHGHERLCFEETDASGWSTEQLHEQVLRSNQRPFDLEAGPVLRAHLFTRSEEDHALLLSIHHISCDFWSWIILLEDLGALYPAEVSGQPASLPPNPHRYEDYVRWQEEWLGTAGGQQARYWSEQLAGAQPMLSLPRDRPRPSRDDQEGASHTALLSPELTARLRELAQAEGTTLYMVLLAAFQVLLHRYTREEDILVVSPASGRSRPEFDRLVGYLVNPIILRAELSGAPTFKDFLGQVRRTVLASLEHQDYPFPLVVEALNPDREPGRPSPFPVCFVFRSAQQSRGLGDLLAPLPTGMPVTLGGLELEPFAIPQQEGQFDLQLELVETRSHLVSVLRYKKASFEPTTIARMQAHLENLLSSIVAEPSRPVSALELLSPAERQQILVDWNDSHAPFNREACAHHLFEAQAGRTPDAVAVVYGEEHLTYAELNAHANRLAHHLRELGVGPEALVGLCAERSLDLMIGILAILKAGGAFVPLDPSYPRDRLALMLESSGALILLTQRHLLPTLPEHRARVVFLDRRAQASTRAGNPGVSMDPAHLAYAIYTSGSTGTPKGVAMSHQSLVNLITWHERASGTGLTTLQFAPTSFDVSIQEMFCTLSNGGCLVLVSEETRRDPLQLLRLIFQQSVQRLFLPVVALHQLAEAADEMQLFPSSLRQVITAGEQLRITPAIERFFQALPGCALHNQYGPTETHLASEFPVPTISSEQAPTPPIGRPTQNVRVYLLDERMQPVPAGVPGEVYIGGAQVARGYVGRPELTAERFVPDPHGSDSGGRLYRTGDLAMYLPNGMMEFLGRADRQVKVRGYRIEPGEIESMLATHPAVRECVVDLRKDGHGQARLVAYVVGTASRSELREHLKRTLPDYMLPAAFVEMESIPLSSSGKIDRRRLPEPSADDALEGYVAPRTPTEHLLATIWADVLNRERVGINDSFFELGGHSLLVVQVTSRIREACSIELPIRTLFEAPTIMELAKHVEASLAPKAIQARS